MSTPKLKLFSPLSWPSTTPTTKLQCAGESYFNYKARSLDLLPFLPPHLQNKHTSTSDSDTGNDTERTSKARKLCLNSTKDPSQYTHYEILAVSSTATAAEIRQAYHKACLTYHPDKSQPIDEDSDSPFLLVKSAFDCLSDASKKRAYDSSLPFDESIPQGKESEKEYYKAYAPVFKRNTRFGAPQKKFKNNPPKFGNDSTPIKEVHAFYEYWTHFVSWRDFSLVASEELKHDVEMADCREEKRWMQKEIDRKAKSLKKEEMSRINTLVERAFNADPRLRREKEREKMEKQKRKDEYKRKKEEKERLDREEKERIEKEKMEKEKREKEEKIRIKKIKDEERKLMREARQQFRKLTIAGFQQDDNKTWKNLEAMSDDIDFLCEQLTAIELDELSGYLLKNNATEENPNLKALPRVKKNAEKQQQIKAQATDAQKKEIAARAQQQEARNSTFKTKSAPWTKEELAALTKAIKKFPSGGSNRWETISNFINNSLQLSTPRSKEECISQYNSAASKSPITNGAGKNGHGKNGSAKVAPTDKKDNDGWTEEQDKQLQDGLKKYPASLDKNERWTSIAKCVTGKGKKDCVTRFKAIRIALKNGKK